MRMELFAYPCSHVKEDMQGLSFRFFSRGLVSTQTWALRSHEEKILLGFTKLFIIVEPSSKGKMLL